MHPRQVLPQGLQGLSEPLSLAFIVVQQVDHSRLFLLSRSFSGSDAKALRAAIEVGPTQLGSPPEVKQLRETMSSSVKKGLSSCGSGHFSALEASS